jgi:hypothetical protein
MLLILILNHSNFTVKYDFQGNKSFKMYFALTIDIKVGFLYNYYSENIKDEQCVKVEYFVSA